MGRIELRLEDADDDAEEEAGTELTFTFFKPMAEGGNAAVAVSARDTLMSVAATDVDTLLGDLASLRMPEPTPVPESEPDPDPDPDSVTR